MWNFLGAERLGLVSKHREYLDCKPVKVFNDNIAANRSTSSSTIRIIYKRLVDGLGKEKSAEKVTIKSPRVARQ